MRMAVPEVHDRAPLVSVTKSTPDRHPAAVYLARLGPGSRRTMKGALDKVAGLLTGGRCDTWTLRWAEVRYAQTAAVRTVLAEQLAPATANKHLCAVRGVLKEAWRLGLMSSEQFHRAVDVPRVRGERLPAGREISSGELRSLMSACVAAGDTAGVRDAALIALAYAGGLRRTEIVGLDLEDLDRDSGELRVRHGKGNKERVVYLASSAMRAVLAWVEVRGDWQGALLCPLTRGGRVIDRRPRGQLIYDALRRRAREASVQALSPHDFRRTFVSHLLEAGADIATVQKLAGHANVTTTARYDRRGEAARRKAAGLLHVPYVVR